MQHLRKMAKVMVLWPQFKNVLDDVLQTQCLDYFICDMFIRKIMYLENKYFVLNPVPQDDHTIRPSIP